MSAVPREEEVDSLNRSNRNMQSVDLGSGRKAAICNELRRQCFHLGTDYQFLYGP